MQNRVFFPQAALDTWLSDGTVDLRGDELTIVAEGRRYKLTEAVRIVSEVTGGDDPHELVGHVKSKSALDEKGAEILESVAAGISDADAGRMMSTAELRQRLGLAPAERRRR